MQFCVVLCQNLCSEQGGVSGIGFIDCQCIYWNVVWYLYDGVEVIYVVQCSVLYWYVEYWDQCFCCNYFWQVCCVVCVGNNYLIFVFFCCFGEVEQFIGGVMGGNYFYMVWDIQNFKNFGGELYGSLVVFGFYYDGDMCWIIVGRYVF